MTGMQNLRRRPLGGRRLLDALFRLASLIALLTALAGMLWIVGTVIRRGADAVNWNFLTAASGPLADSGIGNAILGSVLITLVAALIALPPALAGGCYLAEFGRRGRVAETIRFSANVLMGMPSVLVGLFVYALLVKPMGCSSGLAGSVALAIIMFPVVLRTTEDMLRMVPDSLREAGLALGLTRTRVTLGVIFRAARSGLVTGILLALARVSGETAPLLFTAQWSDNWPQDFCSGPTANLPVLITEYTTNSPYEEIQQAGWGAALVIMAAVLALNIGCRLLLRERHHER